MKKIILITGSLLCVLSLSAFAQENKSTTTNASQSTQQTGCDTTDSKSGSKKIKTGCKDKKKGLSGGAIAGVTASSVVVAGATVAGTGLAIRGAKAAKTAAVQNYKLQLGRAFPKEKEKRRLMSKLKIC